MVFSSITFLFYFLPLVLLLYYALPLRNAVLLAASLLFYAWGEARHLPLLLLSIAGNYACGLAIARAQARGDGGRGGAALAVGVAINLGALAYFKYFNFLMAGVTAVAARLGLPAPHPDPVALPLGISFFTFHALSYLVDVYRRKTAAERDPLALAMYITMFPQLVAGPIIRFATVARQIHHRRHTPARIHLGIQLFIVGLAEKALLANTVAVPADRIFALPAESLPMATAWLGAICYTLQIYFDFCGYSRMAIGLGLMTGFGFPRNFDHPYISTSITEFWRRWHLSLSRWFRDYLYIPLGGNRVASWRNYLNLFSVFFFCGLWHGASWTFVVWGLYHGVLLVLERAGLGAAVARLPRPLRHVYAMALVIVGWIFFRCDTFAGAIGFLRAMAGRGGAETLLSAPARHLTPSVALALVAGVVFATPAFGALWRRALQRATGGSSSLGAMPGHLRLAGAVIALVLYALCAVSLAGGTYNPFIYYRF